MTLTNGKLVLSSKYIKRLLDVVGNAAAAYSLRNLSLTYLGPVVRVRRSSDGVEQDFTSDQVADGTLTTFCGAGDGFVRTWYDQSGNGRNVDQATTTQQPRIVSAGSLLTKNSKPTIDFDGIDDFLSNSTALAQQITLFLVCSSDVTPSTVPDIAFDGNTTTTDRNVFYMDAGTRQLSIYAGNAVSTTTSPTVDTLFLGYGLFNTTASQVGFNGLTTSSGDAGVQVLGLGWRIGGERIAISGYQWNGKISEVVFWTTNQSANRAAIESNINSHYAIY